MAIPIQRAAQVPLKVVVVEAPEALERTAALAVLVVVERRQMERHPAAVVVVVTKIALVIQVVRELRVVSSSHLPLPVPQRIRRL